MQHQGSSGSRMCGAKQRALPGYPVPTIHLVQNEDCYCLSAVTEARTSEFLSHSSSQLSGSCPLCPQHRALGRIEAPNIFQQQYSRM
jgi:hypothetical protein